MSFTNELQFKKFDLHVHTSASTDFKGEGDPVKVVAVALEKGLAAIAITDHQTAHSVDKIKAAAAGKPLVVFPGVELLVHGGESGVHVLLLFDVDKTTEHVHQFLNRIKVYQKDGKPDVAVEMTVGQICDELAVYDSSALVILAHCHSSKGVTGEIKGEVRTQIFQKFRRNLVGAEANESDFTSTSKKSTHKRVIDIFDGTDANYHNRRLGVYQSSDAHSLAEIGGSHTFFKVDDVITIEDIRQSLLDRDTRIRQSFEYKEDVYPRIESLTIVGGFLGDQTLAFHEGLNSILGAKGSGKSLAIEALRFGLNQQPTLPGIREDHGSKLEKCLKTHGIVEVRILDESGKRYLVSRVDTSARDSLACDLMEPCRAGIDAYLLDWITRQPLRREWFVEQSDGNCRLTASFAVRLSETAPIWRRAVAPIAEWVARAIWSTIRKPDSPMPTRLTQNNKREAKGTPIQAPVNRIPFQENICAGCGTSIRRNSTHCPECSLKNSTASLIEGAKLGRAIGHTPLSEARRRESKQRRDLARQSWSPSNHPSWLTEDFYSKEIQPRLKGATLSQISAALGVSIPYASDIRKGRRRPHPRHRQILVELIGRQGV